MGLKRNSKSVFMIQEDIELMNQQINIHILCNIISQNNTGNLTSLLPSQKMVNTKKINIGLLPKLKSSKLADLFQIKLDNHYGQKTLQIISNMSQEQEKFSTFVGMMVKKKNNILSTKQIDLKMYFQAAEKTSLEYRQLKECSVQFDDCNVLELDDRFSNCTYLRVKIKDQLDFRIIKVFELDQLEKKDYNQMFLCLNEYQNNFKHLANQQKKQELVNCHNFFFVESYLSNSGCSHLYFIMDDFSCSLRDLIEIRSKNSEAYTEAMIIKIIKDVLEGLQHLHKAGICHRNIRPENICFSHRTAKYMINNNNLSVSSRISDQISFIGCPIYMPVELTTNISVYDNMLCFKIDYEKYDLYSLGVVAVELIAFKLVCRDLIEVNAFYLFMSMGEIKTIQDFYRFATQKIAFHNYLIHILKIAFENNVVNNLLVRLIHSMLETSPDIRIEIIQALKDIQKVNSFHRTVFENEESDIKYSKYFINRQNINYKIKDVTNIKEYKTWVHIADFYSHTGQNIKAELMYQKILNFMNTKEGKSFISSQEQMIMVLKYCEVLLRLNKNEEVCEILEQINLTPLTDIDKNVKMKLEITKSNFLSQGYFKCNKLIQSYSSLTQAIEHTDATELQINLARFCNKVEIFNQGTLILDDFAAINNQEINFANKLNKIEEIEIMILNIEMKLSQKVKIDYIRILNQIMDSLSAGVSEQNTEIKIKVNCLLSYAYALNNKSEISIQYGEKAQGQISSLKSLDPFIGSLIHVTLAYSYLLANTKTSITRCDQVINLLYDPEYFLTLHNSKHNTRFMFELLAKVLYSLKEHGRLMNLCTTQIKNL